MALKLWQDGVDNASVATIPENGNFKCVGSSFLVKKDPFAYTENKLILKDGFAVDLYDGVAWRQITNRAAIEFDPAENLDTGDTLSHGKDYYVYITLTGTTIAIVVSLNSTYPDGFNANNSRKIGGFHVGHIRKVSDDGLWVPIDSAGNKFGSSGTKWQDNVATGIVPNSVWDLKNRPRVISPGMVKINENLWEGIYIPSVDEAITFMAGTNGLSVAEGKLKIAYGELPATGTEGLNQFNFNELAARQGLRLLSYDEWMQGAFGSPQGEDGSNNYGWTKTTNTARCRTGCQVDPSTGDFDNVNGVKPYAISAKNVVDCAGNVSEWTKTFSLDFSSTNWNWQNVLGANQGQAYLPNSDGLRALRCGDFWANGVHCGPRTVGGDNFPWDVSSVIGARLACDSL
jgi:formylglycine-generating enzyme required for sulfatase activity